MAEHWINVLMSDEKMIESFRKDMQFRMDRCSMQLLTDERVTQEGFQRIKGEWKCYWNLLNTVEGEIKQRAEKANRETKQPTNH